MAIPDEVGGQRPASPPIRTALAAENLSGGSPGGAAGWDVPEVAAVQRLEACPGCRRKFNPAALARHAGVCKAGTPSRKKFNAKKKRWDHFDGGVSKFSKNGSTKNADTPGPADTPSRWKQQSSELRAAMRASRCLPPEE